MNKTKTCVALAAFGLLVLSVLSAPAAVANPSSEEYVGPVITSGNHCESSEGLLGTLPCFENPGDRFVKVKIEDATGLEVNGLIEFRDDSGSPLESVPFCGSIEDVEVPGGTYDVRISRYVNPPPVLNDCIEVFWTTGTITVEFYS